MKPETLYKKYFSPGARGYEFIRAFHLKHARDFAKTELADLDALINQIFLNLTSVTRSKIHGIEEHYVIKAIYFQCWKLLLRETKKEKTVTAESRMYQSDESDPAITGSVKSTEGDPLQILEAGDLFEKIVWFRETLETRDRKILNALLDDKRPLDMTKELRLNYNYLNVRILRLRKKLADYLGKLDRGKIIK